MKQHTFAITTTGKPEATFDIDLPENEEEFKEKGASMKELAQDEYVTRAMNAARGFYRSNRKTVKEIQAHLRGNWQVGGRRTKSVANEAKRIIQGLGPEAQDEAMKVLERLAKASQG